MQMMSMLASTMWFLIYGREPRTATTLFDPHQHSWQDRHSRY